MDLYKAHSPSMEWREFSIFSLLWCIVLFVIVVPLKGGTIYEFIDKSLLSLIGLMLGNYLIGRTKRA